MFLAVRLHTDEFNFVCSPFERAFENETKLTPTFWISLRPESLLRRAVHDKFTSHPAAYVPGPLAADNAQSLHIEGGHRIQGRHHYPRPQDSAVLKELAET